MVTWLDLTKDWKLDNGTLIIVLYQLRQREKQYMYGWRTRKGLKTEERKMAKLKNAKHWYDIEKVELMTEKIVSSDPQDASLFWTGKGINYCVKHSNISVIYIYMNTST